MSKLRRAARALASTRGVVGLTGALLMVPTALMMLGGSHYAREVTNLTRVQQSADATAAAVASMMESGGEAVDPSIGANWMSVNTKVLSESASVTNVSVVQSLSGSSGSVVAKANYRTLSPQGSALGGLHNAVLGRLQVSSRAEVFFRPIEIAMGFDVSRMTIAVNGAQDAIGTILERLYAEEKNPEAVKLSLFAYGESVNVGRKYAEKIVSDETRALALPGSELAPDKTEEAYERQRKVLQAINPALVGDLLAEGGPGYSKDYAAVARPVLKGGSSGDIDEYLQSVDEPPSREEEKFRLMMSDGRSPYVECLNPEMTTHGNMDRWYDTAYMWGGVYDRLSDFVLTEDSWWDWTPYVKDATPSTWGSGYYQFDQWKDATVTVDMNSPVMPILAGSSNPEEVFDHAGMLINTGAMTTCDEAFTWSYRLLASNWANVWSDDGSYPAPEWGETEKHAFLVIDAPLSGFTALKYSSGGTPDIVPQMLEKFAKANIKVHIITGDDNPVLDSINDAMDAYGESLGWEVIVPEDWDFVRALREAVRRQGKVRLTAA